MNINAHKRMIPSLIAFSAVFAAVFCIDSPYTNEVKAEASVNAVSASEAETVRLQANTVYSLTKAVTEEAENINDDTFTDNSPVSFSVGTVSCSESGESDGKIKIIIENGLETDEYYCSFDGGKTFRRMNKRTAVMDGLNSGCYSICVMKNGDRSTLSEIHTIYLSSEDEIIPVEITADSRSEQIYRDGSIRVHISGYDMEKNYEVSIDGGKTWTALQGRNIRFNGLEGGEYTVIAREADNIYNDSAVLKITLSSYYHGSSNYISAEAVLQNPELPTGCEITSLTMLLNYIGYDVDKLVMADNYLPKGEYRNSDFYEVFVGDPRDNFAYGCFSKPIAQAAENYLDDVGDLDKWNVRNITGCTADSLYAAIDRGSPSVVWASMDMKPIGTGKSWTVSETGKTVTWPANEHCLLLIGYSEKKNLVYVNDPLNGTVAYDMSVFEERFESLGCHAVIITEA